MEGHITQVVVKIDEFGLTQESGGQPPPPQVVVEIDEFGLAWELVGRSPCAAVDIVLHQWLPKAIVPLKMVVVSSRALRWTRLGLVTTIMVGPGGVMWSCDVLGWSSNPAYVSCKASNARMILVYSFAHASLKWPHSNPTFWMRGTCSAGLPWFWWSLADQWWNCRGVKILHVEGDSYWRFLATE
jgi:hypothetical protein